MKRIIFTLLALAIMFLYSAAQNVPRDKVIVEIGTGTWCQYCPGAAMGADDLIANGHEVAIIEYHSGDDYQNTYSSARVSYYNITGFPTANFDGGLAYVNGSQTTSLYPQYLPRVNQRIAITSPFTIEVEGTHTCFLNFTANITVDKVGTNSSSNLRLHAVLTESHIEAAWFGLHEINYVCRKMMPNQNGTALTFSGGSTELVTVDFTMDPTWKPEECELVIFVQDQTTKEIFQGTKMSILDFIPEYDFDASISNIINIPTTNCSGSLIPTIIVRNLGAQQLTSLEINYYVNYGDLMYYNWAGALDYMAQEEVVLPEIVFNVEDENELVVQGNFPNGNSDECTSNDVSVASVDRSMYTPNTVKLILRTDANPEETTWEVIDGNGTVLFSGGPYTSSGQTIQETFDLPDEACHSFRIYDSGGNGFSSPGFYMLYYGSNTSISQGIDFGSEKTVEFNTDDPVGVDEPFNLSSGVSVYPNPFTGNTTLSICIEKTTTVSVNVYSLTGQMVLENEAGILSSGEHYLNLDGFSLKPGMYIYKVQAGEENYTGKLVVR